MSDYTVVAIGDALTKVVATGTISLSGPQGEQGEVGPEGPEGDIGPTGLTGPRGIGGPTFTMEGELQTRIGALRWRNFGARNFEGVLLVSAGAPIDDDIVVDVNKNGVTLYSSSKPTILDGDTNSGPISIPDDFALVDDDEITVDIDFVGSTWAGNDLTVEVFVS